ncbi:MAG: endonuclease domain-containing protein [Dehalococcoidales bacterium]|nr:endonuclease domain-containing protein [Dehalococcoidales bacterium]
MLSYNGNLKEHARQLRENMTDAERHLWTRIRMKQLNGYQFYRQKPIGDYIVDFFCPKANLIIEVDGSQHFVDETIEYDRIREEYVSSLGLKVLRFTNAEVLKNIEGVVEHIEEEMSEKIPLSLPFSKGETLASPFNKGRLRGIYMGTEGVR